ncbi:flagellar basal-body MS-ring/collar protein FliF [Cognatishimia maritima]|uniref:Flagellar M-ring protein n=1 Tax=Cognatishimia maritima TaxID=870908 RepID=A0A1M5VX23_9RHOB|nr:flagellar basal-body MS-ring/collar protein FliF [Cognatishimia maritima]SHH79730.1 flagellar M-ring protein FliF [Cognatishimia maritima]
MQNLIKNLMDLGQKRLMILGAVAVGMIAALILGLSAVTSPNYATLYKNLSPATATSVEATLANAGFDARMSEDGQSVMVPANHLARARMVLAETGLPIEGDPGWELFDENSGLAMNTFMQRVNRLRAMEGELARSIQTLEGVQSARVHLVLPEREAFSRERPNPRASVIVRAVPGRAVSRKQASAIRNLVASSVAELELGRVTVLSASGEVILAEASEGDGQVTLQSTKSSIEERLAQEVQNMLTARVGAGNARVRVNVELTNSREVVVEHSFNPDQQVVRSTKSDTEERLGSENAGGGVGVENNIPAALQDGAGGANSTSQSRTGETVEYEIGNTRREVIREAGEVKRISVAVLVNGIYNVQDSEVIYQEREVAEIERLTELVKTAVGFDSARGDDVSVDSLRFMDYSMEVGDPISMSIGDQITQNIVSILQGLLGLVVVALVMILGVRPALRTLLEKPKPALPAAEKAAALTGPDGEPVPAANASSELLPPNGDPARPQTEANAHALPKNTSDTQKPKQNRDPLKPLDLDTHAPGMTSIFDLDDDDGPHEYIETLGVRGNLIKARVEAIQSMAEEKPEDVLRVLRTWLRTEAEA